jgi:hypothetical protein
MTRFWTKEPNRVKLVLDTNELGIIIHLMHLGIDTGDPSLIKLDGDTVERIIKKLTHAAAEGVEY